MGFLDTLQRRIVVGDGALGTMLHAHGVDRCHEELNVTHPEQIERLHRAYVKAGAEVIQTNTYAANIPKLARYGLEDRHDVINRKAVRIARQAAGDDAWVLGTIGGVRGVNRLADELDDIRHAFRHQVDILLNEEVDGLLLETYYDLEELRLVVPMARKLTNVPIIAQVSLQEVGVLSDGTALGDALQQLEALGADVVGMNCRQGPYHTVRSLESISLPKTALLSAYPNASLPHYIDGKYDYPSDPLYFEEAGRALREQGVRLIGGCCGTTPEHIQSLARGLRDRTAVTNKTVHAATMDEVEDVYDGLDAFGQQTVPTHTGQTSAALHEATIANQARTIVERNETRRHEQPLQHIARERTSIIVELDPPKKLNVTRFLEGAQYLKAAGIDALTMADNSLASPRVCNMATGVMVQQELNMRPLIHVTCRDRNLIGLQSHLMGLHALGMNQLLALTGDPAKVGDFPGATSVYDLASFELIELIKQCNEGISFSGKSLGQKTNFSIAGAFNPNVRNLDKAVQRLEKKVRYGADYFISQPVYSVEHIDDIYEATKHLEAPIYIGIMPLTSARNAEFLHYEVPGIKLTDETRKRMAQHAEDRDAARAEGIAMAKELIDAALPRFNGIYLITPFLRFDMTETLTRYIHANKPTSTSKTSNTSTIAGDAERNVDHEQNLF